MYVEVEPGVRVRVHDWGNGKPVLFVHGYPFNGRIFEHQMLFLAENGYRAVALDLRGFGESDKPWNCNYETWSQDVGKVLVALDLQEVTLAGFSMGGAIATHYAATASDSRVAKLALLGAATPNAAPAPENKELLNGFIQAAKTDPAAFSKGFVQNAFAKQISPELTGFYASMGTTASLRVLIHSLEELRDRDLSNVIGSISVPTRIFHGVLDKTVPFALGEYQQQLIPGATLVRFEESAHGLFFEEKDKLNTELLAFHAE